MSDGKLIVFSAPSGSGKTTIVKHLLKQPELNLEFSISATSRKKRGEEINGKDYYFLSAKEFISKIKNKEFLEWEEVYRDNFYGTLKTEIERIWALGKHVIFDIDVSGGLRIKRKFPDVVAYKVDEGNYKLAAGWMIDRLGWKGESHGGAAVHDKQALVLVNKNGATGKDILELAKKIQESVLENFNVKLECEVNIIG